MIYNTNLKKKSKSSNIVINNPTTKDMINIENYEIHVLKELNKKSF